MSELHIVLRSLLPIASPSPAHTHTKSQRPLPPSLPPLFHPSLLTMIDQLLGRAVVQLAARTNDRTAVPHVVVLGGGREG